MKFPVLLLNLGPAKKSWISQISWAFHYFSISDHELWKYYLSKILQVIVKRKKIILIAKIVDDIINYINSY